MEKLIAPWSFSYNCDGKAINERMIIKENEIIVITREHNDLLNGKYYMKRKADHYTLSVGKKQVKDMACNIIADFFEMDRGVLLTYDDNLEDLAEEIIKAIESGDYKKKVSKWIDTAIYKDDIGEDIYIHVGKTTDINCELKGMREKALKLPTAQNEEILDEYIVVSPSQYNRIEAFARCNDYIIGEEAQKVLDHWKELQEKAIIIRANPCELSENNRL